MPNLFKIARNIARDLRMLVEEGLWTEPVRDTMQKRLNDLEQSPSKLAATPGSTDFESLTQSHGMGLIGEAIQRVEHLLASSKPGDRVDPSVVNPVINALEYGADLPAAEHSGLRETALVKPTSKQAARELVRKTVTEICNYTGIPETTVRRYLTDGKFSAKSVGDGYFEIPQHELDDANDTRLQNG